MEPALLHHTYKQLELVPIYQYTRDRRNSMVVGFTTTYAIIVCHHSRCDFESRSWRGVLDTTSVLTMSTGSLDQD